MFPLPFTDLETVQLLILPLKLLTILKMSNYDLFDEAAGKPCRELATVEKEDNCEYQGPYIYIDPGRLPPFSLAWLVADCNAWWWKNLL
jgi:hypothetical protein